MKAEHLVAPRGSKPKRKWKSKEQHESVTTRPVMKRTSDTEIDFYVNQYQGRSYPDYGDELCHAARFWIVTRLLQMHKGLSSRHLSRHFNMSRKMFEKKNRLNLKNDPKYYDYLSPGEANTKSRAATIRIYGRKIDKLDYGVKERV